jgi:hypothetical protein
VALIGVAGVFVLSDETDFPIGFSLTIAAAAVVLAWIAVERNWVGAVTAREPSIRSKSNGHEVRDGTGESSTCATNHAPQSTDAESGEP